MLLRELQIAGPCAGASSELNQDEQRVVADDLFEEKRNVIFDHLLASFFDDGGSVYATGDQQSPWRV